MKNAIIVGAIAAAMSAAPAFAQSTMAKNPKGQTQAGSSATAGSATAPKATAAEHETAADRKFIDKAAQGGLAEVELGNLAKDKASSQQVKQFGQRMVDDHSKANDELKTLARNKGVTLPTDLSAKDKALKDRLSKLSGEQFDRAYMQAMVRDHRQDVNEFRKESKSAKDPDVKAFAAKTLPTLEDHLKLAQQDSGAVATSGTKSSAKSGKSKKPSGATDRK